MKAWRPSRWLPLIMLAWGVVITLTGIVQNFTGLFIARVFVSSNLPVGRRAGGLPGDGGRRSR
jgi:hypothetical protein